MRIVTPSGVFEWIAPESEDSFEQAIKSNLGSIFGEGRHYIDCKRRIGLKAKKSSIPDAYLLDLRRKDPRLFVVENELSEHDLFKHIGVQLLQFSHNYRQADRQVKALLHDEISKTPRVMEACEKYAKANGYRNTDNLLDYLVFDTPFQAIVMINEVTDELNSVIKQFSFPVEVIEFVTYQDTAGKKAYRFTPFLQDVSETVSSVGKPIADIGDIDTIVVPAREDGFKEVFLAQDRWYAIRIHSSMIPQIKHIAAYRVAPVSAITHVAPVNRIVPWKDTGKYCLEFAQPAHEIAPIKPDQPGRGKAPQGPRYTSMSKLVNAKNWEDAF
jgi:hypothetical protein